MLADRMTRISGSPTLAITAKVSELRKKGVKVYSFGAGEPDFDTPSPVVDAAVDALRKGFTRYTASTGIPELRACVADKLKRDNGLCCSPEQVIVTAGAKQAIFNAILALVNPGDDVLIPLPYWVSYPEMARLAGGNPVYVPLSESNGFRLTRESLEPVITPKSKVLILNSPNNPTGSAMTLEDVTGVCELCADKGIWVISDEIYEKLQYEGVHVSPASLDKRFYDITITVNGVSKAYCMTGWRMGYCAAPLPVAKAMSKIQDHSTSNITSFVQKACITALNLPSDTIEAMRAEFDERRKLMVRHLNDIPGMRCTMPAGAFYAFASIDGLIGRSFSGRTITNSMDFAELALDKACVAVVPGSAFGAENYVRLSYATSREDISAGLAGLRKALS
jgi:aspartate aminotransferase